MLKLLPPHMAANMSRTTPSWAAAAREPASTDSPKAGERTRKAAKKGRTPLAKAGGGSEKRGAVTTTTPLPSLATPPRSDQKTPLVVKGTRMSGVKHSGLLASDRQEEADWLSEEDTTPNLSLSALSKADKSREDGSGEFQAISGRDIYSVKKKAVTRQHTARPQSGRTPSRGSQSHKETGTDSTGASKDKQKQKSAKSNEDDKEASVTHKRSTRSRHPPSQTESEESVSEEEEGEEREELGAIAAQLNCREAALSQETVLEDYFTAHAGKTGPTSDHTLAKLARPRMDRGMVERALKAAPSTFQKDCQLLSREHRSLFTYWLFQMSHGYNVLLHGLGSKQRLMESFRQDHLSRACHLVVNGFFPGLTCKQVLTALSSDLLGFSGTFKSVYEQAEFICSSLRQSPRELFLVIHNIDGPMLRAEKSQLALSTLAQSPHVHIIASLDHINAPLIWDQNKLSRFNWLWHDVTTFELYREETSYENSLLVQQSGTLALSSLLHVTRSLTPNAQGIFHLLIRYQLDHHGDASFQGLAFNDLYTKCRERFLVNSDLTLRSQLTEFRDHKLVRLQKGSDGVEYLTVAVDHATLTQFLEEQVEE